MAIGQDVGLVLCVGEHEAGTLADDRARRALLRPPRQGREIVAEETAEQIILERPLAGGRRGFVDAFDLNEHHRRRSLFRHGGKRLAGRAQALDAGVLGLQGCRHQRKQQRQQQPARVHGRRSRNSQAHGALTSSGVRQLFLNSIPVPHVGCMATTLIDRAGCSGIQGLEVITGSPNLPAKGMPRSCFGTCPQPQHRRTEHALSHRISPRPVRGSGPPAT